MISQYESMNEERRETGSRRSGEQEKRNRGWRKRSMTCSEEGRFVFLQNLGYEILVHIRIDFVFGFDRKILGERNNFLDLSRCLTRSITRSTNYEEEGGGRSTLEDGRNSLVDGGTTPVLFRIINFSMEVLSKGWRPELN